MGKKSPKEIKLGSNWYLDTKEGIVFYKYGGYAKIGRIKVPKNSQAFKKVLETYGTKEGKKVREAFLLAVLKAVKTGKGKLVIYTK